MTFLVYIELQNFTRIHTQKRILQVLLLFQQSIFLYIWLTFWLLSKREYNHTGTKSIHVIASIKCEYWNTARIFWIDLILVFNLKIVSVQKFDCYSLETISSEKCINTFKEFIYNAINFKMVSNITHW
jgi:hypothetical protein